MALFSENSSTTAGKTTAEKNASYGKSTVSSGTSGRDDRQASFGTSSRPNNSGAASRDGSGAGFGTRDDRMPVESALGFGASHTTPGGVPMPQQNPLSDTTKFNYQSGRDRDYIFSGADNPAISRLVGLQEDYDSPLTITSGSRPPALNAKVGGVGGSQHLTGKAFDIAIPDTEGTDTARLIEAAKNSGFTGIGGYRPGKVHVDTGAERIWGPDTRASSIDQLPASMQMALRSAPDASRVLAMADQARPQATVAGTVAPYVKAGIGEVKDLTGSAVDMVKSIFSPYVPKPMPKPTPPSSGREDVQVWGPDYALDPSIAGRVAPQRENIDVWGPSYEQDPSVRGRLTQPEADPYASERAALAASAKREADLRNSRVNIEPQNYGFTSPEKDISFGDPHSVIQGYPSAAENPGPYARQVPAGLIKGGNLPASSVGYNPLNNITQEDEQYANERAILNASAVHEAELRGLHPNIAPQNYGFSAPDAEIRAQNYGFVSPGATQPVSIAGMGPASNILEKTRREQTRPILSSVGYNPLNNIETPRVTDIAQTPPSGSVYNKNQTFPELSYALDPSIPGRLQSVTDRPRALGADKYGDPDGIRSFNGGIEPDMGERADTSYFGDIGASATDNYERPQPDEMTPERSAAWAEYWNKKGSKAGNQDIPRTLGTKILGSLVDAGASLIPGVSQINLAAKVAGKSLGSLTMAERDRWNNMSPAQKDAALAAAKSRNTNRYSDRTTEHSRKNSSTGDGSTDTSTPDTDPTVQDWVPPPFIGLPSNFENYGYGSEHRYYKDGGHVWDY